MNTDQIFLEKRNITVQPCSWSGNTQFRSDESEDGFEIFLREDEDMWNKRGERYETHPGCEGGIYREEHYFISMIEESLRDGGYDGQTIEFDEEVWELIDWGDLNADYEEEEEYEYPPNMKEE